LAALAFCLFAVACGPDREDSVTPYPQAPSGPGVAPQRGAGPLAAGPAPECEEPPEFQRAAAINAASSRGIAWAPYGRDEVGWAVYAPKIAAEIGVRCAPHDPAFAAALARWQRSQGMPADGVLSSAVFDAMKTRWHQVRPYVALRGQGVCPQPPPEWTLAHATPNEGYRGKEVVLRPGALAAYRRMVAAARAEDPAIAADPELLTIFSAYRSPEYDAERCAREGNCNGITRAQCSVHRTAMAIDLVVGAAPGHTVDSSADENRLFMTRSPAYLWLVANAHRFGFVNYVFEPWHWEWTGEPLVTAQDHRPLGRRGTDRKFEPFPPVKETARAPQSRQARLADPAPGAGGRLRPAGSREQRR
jgi:zinc D-Ala-D-Ala carboxypeptidase